MKTRDYAKDVKESLMEFCRCGRRLAHVVVKQARERNLPPEERIHTVGGVFLVRRPVGTVVLGDCIDCGLVRHYPMTEETEQ